MYYIWYLVFQPRILCPILAKYRILLLLVFFRLSGKGRLSWPRHHCCSFCCFFSPFTSPEEEGRLKDRGSVGWKKVCAGGSIDVKRQQEGKVLFPSFFGQKIKEQRKGGRKAWSGPIATAFTIRKLERKWVKLPLWVFCHPKHMVLSVKSTVLVGSRYSSWSLPPEQHILKCHLCRVLSNTEENSGKGRKKKIINSLALQFKTQNTHSGTHL